MTDVHTHRPYSGGIINIEPGEPLPAGPFSCGIHPWHAAGATEDDYRTLEQTLSSPNAVAVGETGIDLMRGAEAAIQREAFRRHIDISERVRKPLIVHSVKSWQEIIRIRKECRATLPWVFHGFRLKPDIALRLVASGIIPSFGERFNPDSFKAVYPHNFLLETDESRLDTTQIAVLISEATGIPAPDILTHAAANAARTLGI